MAAVKGNKYVIGLDPLNEPFPTGPKFEDFVALMDPAIYDNDYLAPLYKRIQGNVTKFEEDNVLFFEPGQMPDEIMDAVNFVLGIDLFKDRGFTKPPGGEFNSPNHVLNAHTYCCNVWPSMCSDWGQPDFGSAATCSRWHERRVNFRDKQAKELGIPWIMSEFGACIDNSVCAREIRLVTGYMEQVLGSWAYWQFKTYGDFTNNVYPDTDGFYNTDGSIASGKVKMLTRPYVRYAQGTILSSKWHQHTYEAPELYEARVRVDTSITEPTEVFAFRSGKGESWFPNGVNATVWSDDEVKPLFDQHWEGNYLYIKVTNHEFDGKELQIRLETP